MAYGGSRFWFSGFFSVFLFSVGAPETAPDLGKIVQIRGDWARDLKNRVRVRMDALKTAYICIYISVLDVLQGPTDKPWRYFWDMGYRIIHIYIQTYIHAYNHYITHMYPYPYIQFFHLQIREFFLYVTTVDMHVSI